MQKEGPPKFEIYQDTWSIIKHTQALNQKMFDLHALLAGVAFVIGNIAITFATVTYARHVFGDKKRQKDEYELLKNGLLTMALSMVYSNEIDQGNYNYDEYDGSMLPPLSGSDLVNAYMSYIVDSNNPHIHAKYNAIQRFLHSNILTDRDQEQFMEHFIVLLNSFFDGAYEQEDASEQPTDEAEDNTNKEKEE
jgi:hypothetical protein